MRINTFANALHIQPEVVVDAFYHLGWEIQKRTLRSGKVIDYRVHNFSKMEGEPEFLRSLASHILADLGWSSWDIDAALLRLRQVEILHTKPMNSESTSAKALADLRFKLTGERV